MLKKYKNGFIPAALVCLGVEHAPGSLPCQEGVTKGKECNPYEVKVTKNNLRITSTSRASNSFITKNIAHTKEKSINSLYNRKSESELNEKAFATKIEYNSKGSSSKNSAKRLLIKNILASKVIVKTKDKDIKINNNDFMESKPKVEKKTPINNTYTYVVKEGDTLSLIAKEFGLNIKRILKLNNLTKNSHIKVGQKLKLPKNSLKIVKAKNSKRFHIVKKGETLTLIAKKYNIELKKLLEYNNLAPTDHIKVGQKIFFSKQRLKKSLTVAKKNTPPTPRARVLKVTATAYTSHKNQTDSTPFLAAWNNRIRPGMKIIAVSRDLIKKYGLTNGVKVKIKGLPGIYTVRDKMNKRYRRRIDIYMGLNKKKALKWGKRKITLLVIK